MHSLQVNPLNNRVAFYYYHIFAKMIRGIEYAVFFYAFIKSGYPYEKLVETLKRTKCVTFSATFCIITCVAKSCALL